MIDEEEKSTTRALIIVTRGRDSLGSLFVGLVERLTSGALCGSASVSFILFFPPFIAASSSVCERHFRVLPYISRHAARINAAL